MKMIPEMPIITFLCHIKSSNQMVHNFLGEVWYLRDLLSLLRKEEKKLSGNREKEVKMK